MIHRKIQFSLLLVLALCAVAFAQQLGEKRALTGTWTCLSCDLKGLDGSDHKQCEDAGHKHCLKLDNGNYVFFLENDRSADIIKGGRKHDVRITVEGTYYPKAHTIDVQSYTIDGRKTAWCDTHHRMDMDAASSSKQANAEDPEK